MLQIRGGATAVQLGWGEGESGSLERSRLSAALADFHACLAPPAWSRPRADAPACLQRLGKALAQACPARLREWLKARPAHAPLPLQIDDDALPWELLQVEGAPLWQRFGCARAGPHRESPGGAVTRALVLTGPRDLCPWARTEGKLVESVLGRGLAVDAWDLGEVTPARLLEALSSGRYGILHCLACLEHDPDSPWQSRLLLGEDGLQAGMLQALRAPGLGLVCLHLVGQRRPLESAELWSQIFLRMGAGCLVTHLWEPSPTFSRTIYASFYSALLAGEPAEAALTRARGEALKLETPDPYCTAASFTLSGEAGWGLGARASHRATTLTTALRPGFRFRVESGPEAGREIPIYPQALALRPILTLGGRGLRPGDIELEDPSLAGQIASLEWTQGTLRLTNLSKDSSRVRVNGLGLSQTLTLQGGERIELGDSCLRFEVLDERVGEGGEEPASRLDFVLECVAGTPQDLGLLLELTGGFAVVGRLPECSLRLYDRSVSRHQFSLVARDGAYHLTHLGSNPTILNGLEVGRERELKSGDLIQIGSGTTLRFQSGPS